LEEDPDLETGFKVVAIMQTITEELDESGKRIWRKMLGISPESTNNEKASSETGLDNQNSIKE
jgi:hypothetical protein